MALGQRTLESDMDVLEAAAAQKQARLSGALPKCHGHLPSTVCFPIRFSIAQAAEAGLRPPGPPASTAPELGWQVCIIMPWFDFCFQPA